MRLHHQLMAVAALTLALPVVVWVGMKGMDRAIKTAADEKLTVMSRAAKLYVESVSQTPAIADFFAIPVLLGQGTSNPESSQNKSSASRWVATPIHYPMVLDGYDDEWVHSRLHEQPLQAFPDEVVTNGTGRNTVSSDGSSTGAKLRLAVRDDQLHIFLSVTDDVLVFHQPTQRASHSEFEQTESADIRPALSTGDHITLVEKPAGAIVPAVTASAVTSDAIKGLTQAAEVKTVFRAVAPGPMTGQRYGQSDEGITPVVADARYRGVWVTTNAGYQMELVVPLPPVGTVLDFRISDYDTPDDYWTDYLTDGGQADARRPGDVGARRVLTYPSAELSARLDTLVGTGSQLRVFDLSGYLVAEANKLYDTAESGPQADGSFINAILYRFFGWMLDTDRQTHVNVWQLKNTQRLSPNSDVAGEVKRYRTLENDSVVGSLQSIIVNNQTRGYLLLETKDDIDTAFASTAMIRIFMLVTLASIVITGLLLLYASWLSYRIREVTRRATHAVSADGRVLHTIEPSTDKDEIGELSRSLARLVERSSEYTRYLESLASRLTHEFRTPLSVVRTSLENLDSDTLDAEQRALLQRAAGGADHLGGLIRSMNEATRLEQVIGQGERVWFDPRAWLQHVVAGYRAVHAPQTFTMSVAASVDDSQWYAMPETLQQALDKLVSNATDFCPLGQPISIQVEQRFGIAIVEVSHIMPVQDVSESLLNQDPMVLFEPLHSERDRQSAAHWSARQSARAHLGLGLYIVKLVAAAHSGQPIARIDTHVADTDDSGLQSPMQPDLVQPDLVQPDSVQPDLQPSVQSDTPADGRADGQINNPSKRQPDVCRVVFGFTLAID